MTISLRDVADDDIAVFFAHQTDAEAITMAAFTSKDPNDEAAHRAHWEKIRAHEAIRTCTILENGEVAGHLASWADGDVRELTYWIDRPRWGRGIASEALRQFLEGEAGVVEARVATDNAGSIRVLERNGFQRVGTESGFAHGRGAEIEEYRYRRA